MPCAMPSLAVSPSSPRAAAPHRPLPALAIRGPRSDWRRPPARRLAAGRHVQIRIINADNGIVVTQSDFVSVRSVSLVVERPRWSQSTYPDNGHHALMIGRSADVSFRL